MSLICAAVFSDSIPIVARHFTKLPNLCTGAMLNCFPNMLKQRGTDNEVTYISAPGIRYHYQQIRDQMMLVIIVTETSNIYIDTKAVKIVTGAILDLIQDSSSCNKQCLRDHSISIIQIFDCALSRYGTLAVGSINDVNNALIMDSAAERSADLLESIKIQGARNTVSNGDTVIQKVRKVIPDMVPEPIEKVTALGGNVTLPSIAVQRLCAESVAVKLHEEVQVKYNLPCDEISSIRALGTLTATIYEGDVYFKCSTDEGDYSINPAVSSDEWKSNCELRSNEETPFRKGSSLVLLKWKRSTIPDLVPMEIWYTETNNIVTTSIILSDIRFISNLEFRYRHDSTETLPQVSIPGAIQEDSNNLTKWIAGPGKSITAEFIIAKTTSCQLEITYNILNPNPPINFEVLNNDGTNFSSVLRESSSKVLVLFEW